MPPIRYISGFKLFAPVDKPRNLHAFLLVNSPCKGALARHFTWHHVVKQPTGRISYKSCWYVSKASNEPIAYMLAFANGATSLCLPYSNDLNPWRRLERRNTPVSHIALFIPCLSALEKTPYQGDRLVPPREGGCVTTWRFTHLNRYTALVVRLQH